MCDTSARHVIEDDMLGKASLVEVYRGSYLLGSPLGLFGRGALLASLAVVCLFVCLFSCVFLVFPPFRGFGVESGMIKVKVQGCLLSSPGSPNIGSSRYCFTLVLSQAKSHLGVVPRKNYLPRSALARVPPSVVAELGRIQAPAEMEVLMQQLSQRIGALEEQTRMLEAGRQATTSEH